MERINDPNDSAVLDSQQPRSGIDSGQCAQAGRCESGSLNKNHRYSILTFGWGAPADSIALLLPHHAVEFASSGRDAFVRLNARAFDAYILDYFVPDWGGPPLCREIRKQDPHAPIIFYSTYQNPRAIRRMLHAGANIHLSKPDDTGLLPATVDSMLESADRKNALARESAQLAVVTELDRLTALAHKLAGAASSLSPQSKLRTTRLAACKAFLAAGGTCAGFERWWTAASLPLTGAPFGQSMREGSTDS